MNKSTLATIALALSLAACSAEQGPPGPAGREGPQGPPGAVTWQTPEASDAGAVDAGGDAAPQPRAHVVYSDPVDVLGRTTASAKCPGEETMLSGGCQVSEPGELVTSYPVPFGDSPTYWLCVATSASRAQLWVFLVCE